MASNDRTMAAGEFKARCLKLLDDVQETGRSVLVTKRGRPVARVVPASARKRASLEGSVLEEDDIVSPLAERWSVLER